jgi:hypothetical protein
VFSWDSFRARRARRPRRRIGAVAPERLEGRALMAYTSLGFSLADLAVTGEASPVAQWGGTVTVDVTLRNLGASTITEPTSLTPPLQVGVGPDGSVSPPYYTPSQAGAAGSTIGVFLVPRGRGPAAGVKLGTIEAPGLGQNNIEQFRTTLTIPERPAGFPGRGPYSIRLVANDGRTVLESNYRNNVSPAIPIQLTAAPATPTLRVVSFDLPDRGLIPGDVIAPRIQVANIGNASVTEDVEVAVVASTSPDFNVGSSIVSLYTIPGGIGGVNSTPLPIAARHLRGPRDLRHNIITPQSDVATINGGLATLPISPPTYYLGVVIDPFNKLNLPNQPANRLEMIKIVSAIPGETPTVVVGGPATQPFQYPPDGVPVGVIY